MAATKGTVVSPTVVEEQRVVNAGQEMVFTMLTAPVDIDGWLANEARCEMHPGGIYSLRWINGFSVSGKVARVEHPGLFAVNWRGYEDPAATEVEFRLEPVGEATRVTVRHSGFGSGSQWDSVVAESRKGWPRSLDNLQYMVQTGIDLRDERRPMMGINLGEEFDARIAAREGIDAQAGVYLEGVIAGMGAEQAGLRAHDVIISIDGHPVPDFGALVTVMQRHESGDVISVGYVRGKEHGTAVIELKPAA